jgi:two-component system response regulator
MAKDEVEIRIVEDDPDDLELARRALSSERISHRIRVAQDGEEALDSRFCRNQFHGRDRGCQPKLILPDLKRLKVSGLDVLREIKEHPQTQALPVVIMTSSKQEQDRIRGYHLGVNSYLQKPVDFDRFRETIKHLGYYWLLVNQAPPAQALAVAERSQPL